MVSLIPSPESSLNNGLRVELVDDANLASCTQGRLTKDKFVALAAEPVSKWGKTPSLM